MYRNYEEYMRTVLGYNPNFNNTYINPYNNVPLNNFNDYDNYSKKDEYEEFSVPKIRENREKQEEKTKRVPQNATSYKNFLRF